jgi:hypothetical protein
LIANIVLVIIAAGSLWIAFKGLPLEKVVVTEPIPPNGYINEVYDASIEVDYIGRDVLALYVDWEIKDSKNNLLPKAGATCNKIYSLTKEDKDNISCSINFKETGIYYVSGTVFYTFDKLIGEDIREKTKLIKEIGKTEHFSYSVYVGEKKDNSSNANLNNKN